MRYGPGTILIVSLDPVAGSEQAGERPVIIVSSQNRILLVIPLTSNQKTLERSHTYLLNPGTQNLLVVPSVALVFQMRSIDESRIKKQLGSISKKDAEALNLLLGKVAQIDLNHLPE
jgi:mRNA interferase MazF